MKQKGEKQNEGKDKNLSPPKFHFIGLLTSTLNVYHHYYQWYCTQDK